MSKRSRTHLQSGRIAWAYNNRERAAFLQQIMRVVGLDHEAVREVLDECRTQRKHVAETLIEWGLAGEQDVRRALWTQIASTLQLIAREADAEALFLRRQQAPYDERLTFSLHEFDRSSFSSLPLSDEENDLLRREGELQQTLAESVPTSLWLRLVRPGSRSSSTNLILRAVAELLGEMEAVECAYRESVGWLYGLRQPEGYLFCGLRLDMPLSKARSALQPGHLSPPLSAPLALGEPLAAGPSSLDSLVPLFASLGFLAGIFHCSPQGMVSLLREGAPAGLADQISLLDTLFTLPLTPVIQPSPSPAALQVSRGARVVLPGLQLLGSPIGQGSLWLAVCPSVREGLGWGLLANALLAIHETPQ